MKSIPVKVLIILTIIFCNFCTIEQHVHFKKDFSGSVEYSIDISSLNSMNSLLSEGEESINDSLLKFDEQKLLLTQIEGISNVDYNTNNEKNTLTFKYDFSNLDVLNSAYNKGEFGITNNQEHTYFIKKGKKLLYNMPELTENDKENEYGEMMELFEYKLTISFDGKIKKVDNPDAIISEDKHSVTITTNFANLYSENVDLDMEIKTKN